MSDVLKVAGIQTRLEWEAKTKNLKNFERLISKISDEVDLIVLPEMFTTGFTMNPSFVAESMAGRSVEWMREMAVKKETALIGSLVIEEQKNFVNRCVFVHPNGSIETYDKRHTFTLAGEDKVYQAGTKRLIVNYKGWKICPMICYDLRFPVWIRNTKEYDLLIFMANWPKPRITAWDTLIKARAIENMSYTIGVNRIGVDENDYEYSGHSAIIDTLGTVITDLNQNEEGVLYAELNKTHQNKIRTKLNFLNDQDDFSIQV